MAIQKNSISHINAYDNIRKINYLIVNDFMSFSGYHKFTFDQGNLLLGENGVGKSSIFEAIIVSLGETGRNNKLSNYINFEADIANLILNISLISGLELEITTIISSEGKRIQKKVEVSDGTSYERSQALNFLKSFNFDIFSSVAFVKQSGGEIISSSPSQTTKNIRDIFKADFWKEFDETVLDIKNLNEAITNTSFNLSECNGKLHVMKNNLEANTKSLNKFNEEIRMLESYINQNDLYNESSLKLEEENLISRIALLSNKKQENNNILQDISKKEQNLKLENDKVNLYNDNIIAYNKTLEELNSKLTSVTDINKLNDSINQLTEENNNLLKERNKLSILYGEEKKNKEIQLDKLSKVENGICPVCESYIPTNKLSSFKSQINNFDLNIKKLDEGIKYISKKIEENSLMIKSFINEKDLVFSLENDKTKIIKKIEEFKYLKETHQKNADALKEYILNVSSKNLFSLEDKKELELALDTLDGIRIKLKNIQKLKDLKINCENILKEISLIDSQISEESSNKESLSLKLTKLNKDLQVCNQAKGLFYNTLSSYYINSIILNDIKPRMSAIVSKFGYSGVDIELDQSNMTYYITLLKGLYKISIGQLSNFEFALMQFSIKLAIIDILGIKVLCFDEPDYSAAASNESIMASLLKEVITQDLEKQLILVTHSETTKDSLSSLCSIIEIGNLKK